MVESMNKPIRIGIKISWNAEVRRYIWTFDGHGVDPTTGNFKLPGPGKTPIVYKLDPETALSYQLLYVNLDPANCATHEIESVAVHKETNSLTIIDRNSYHCTRSTPFSLRLVARMTDQIGSGFLSADPQVTNNPNDVGVPPK
jgi:hypothetical protein